MPNWCNNQITITGPAAEITALWDRAELMLFAEGREVEADAELDDATSGEEFAN